MFYDLNISKFVSLMLPPILRSDAIVALLRVMTSPISTMVTQFLAYRSVVNDRLNISGHVLPLETTLNKACSSSDIRIESVHVVNGVILYHEAENQTPPYLYNESEAHEPPVYLTTENEAPPDINFIVHVPSTLSSLTTRIENILNRYKPAGRRYEIQFTE